MAQFFNNIGWMLSAPAAELASCDAWSEQLRVRWYDYFPGLAIFQQD